MADIPNYLSLIIEVIAIPVIILVWQSRIRRSIPGLDVSLARGSGQVDGTDVHFLRITFTNRTREVVYLRNARLKPSKCKKQISELPPTHLAQRDISSSCYPLRFKEGFTSNYTQHEIILHDGTDVETVLPLNAAAHDNVLAFSRKFWRIWPHYFTLYYTAAVGDKLFRVVTKY